MRRNPVVLYDGQCAFCRVCARLLRRLDRGSRLDLLDFNLSEADPILAALPAAERRTALHVADADGSMHSAGPALRQALAVALSPGAGRPLTSPAVARIIDAGYRFIAARRNHLGWIERLVPQGDGLDSPRR